jgi:hypothetical protein
MESTSYDLANSDFVILAVVLIIIFVIVIISIFLLKWILGIKKIIRNLETTNIKLEENNELLRDIIEDINYRKEKGFEQQKLNF